MIVLFFIYTLLSKGPPVIQFPGHAPPPTSFGAPPGTPSAPGALPYPQSGNIGFTSSAPVSFGMPQPYSPYPVQPSHPMSNQCPPPAPGAPVQQIPLPMPQSPSPYPSQQMQQPYPGQPSVYPQQQDYNMYPNLRNAPDAKECFNIPSPYTSASNAHSNNSSSYQGGSYPGGQGTGYYSPHTGRSSSYQPTQAPAPRRNQFTPKVRLTKDV